MDDVTEPAEGPAAQSWFAEKGSWIALGLVTAMITIGLTFLSMQGGGFASGAAMQSRAAGGFVGWPIAIHLATALPAVALGPVILMRRKGDRVHKLLGRMWACLMIITAIASAFIRTPGAGILGSGFSYIHLFTVWTAISIPLGVYAIRKGDIKAHRQTMIGLYFGLCIAGAFTLLPDRLLGSMVFG